MEWKELFNHRILQRGKDYADSGKVSDIQYKPGELCASINGREHYDIKISFDKSKNITRMNCTCPSAAEIYYCKHCAAVLYKAEELMAQNNSIADDTLASTAEPEKIIAPHIDSQSKTGNNAPVKYYEPKCKA